MQTATVLTVARTVQRAVLAAPSTSLEDAIAESRRRNQDADAPERRASVRFASSPAFA